MAAAPRAVACEEKARLIRENEVAIDDYFQATMRELDRKRATSQKTDYVQLAEAVFNAKRFAERAHLRLQRHIAEHGC